MAVNNGEVLLSDGFGMATDDEMITGDTVFRVGSVTKSFTAIAVARLAEEGLIDLDSPCVESLPFRAVRRTTR